MTQSHAPGISSPACVAELWLALKHRFRVLWCLLLGALPCVFLLGHLFNAVLGQYAALAVVGLLWFAATFWAGARVASFPCPRCGKAFFESWYFFKMLRRNCAHCNLPRNERDITPARSGDSARTA